MASITLRKGDNQIIRGAVTDRETMLPLDITGWGIRFTVKRRWPDAAAVVAKTSLVDGGIIITSAAAGEFAVSILPADFSGIPNAERTVMLYDVQIQREGPATQTLGQGECIILGDITTS